MNCETVTVEQPVGNDLEVPLEWRITGSVPNAPSETMIIFLLGADQVRQAF